MRRNIADRIIHLIGGASAVSGLFLVMFVVACADSTGREAWSFLFKVLAAGIVLMAVGLPLHDRR